MSEDSGQFGETLKRAAVTLKTAGVLFCLAGGYAAYARGGNPSLHDVDFFLREQDVEVALQAFEKAGFRIDRPPEDWLVKVYDEDRLVDLIFEGTGLHVDDALLARADEMEVLSVRMPVLDATDLFVGKLLAYDPHDCDFTSDLAQARALREQVDWQRVAAQTQDSPYARAFLLLARDLGIADLGESSIDISKGKTSWSASQP